MAAVSPSVGQVLGHFRLLERIGAGGMGIVFRARDTRLERDVAIKVLNQKTLRDASGKRRFRREALVLSRLNHPNVEVIYEFPVDDSVDYIVMEFVPGTSLDDRLRRGAVPETEVLELGVQLARGLAAAHARGIIHRDLKPGNLRVTPDRVLKILDFGLAQLFALPDDETVTMSLPMDESIAGTLPYMAPEQLQGKQPDTRSDVYSAGVVLYEMSTGRRPFADQGAMLRHAILASAPKAPRETQPKLSPRLERLILRCLEKDPNARFQSASELLAELAVIAAEDGVTVTSKPARPRLLRASIKTRALIISGALLILIAAIAPFVWSRLRTPRPPSPEAQRWYDLGTAALREATYVKASRALQMAVDHDKDFALAHAKLADAWQELDFTGKAQREMLQATMPRLQRQLGQNDRDYIEAIGATLTQDYGRAVQAYNAILGRAPDESKAPAYVDLGRAEEKAGNVNEAVNAYQHAAQLAPEDPAAFVHLGILESRRQHTKPAEEAFAKAESLYNAETNLEGVAEVDYQEGYAASLRGNSQQAKDYFQKSLQLAAEIPSVQLQIRALTRLATAEYIAANDDKAIDLAQRAIKLARENNLDYWAMDGLVRLGNAYLGHDISKAEAPFQEALQLAEQTQTPRVAAAARLGLANIRDQQDKPDDTLGYAQPALAYYQKNNFVRDAAQASNLIVRAQLAKGQFKSAQQGSTALLELSNNSNNSDLLKEAEELAGMVYLASEEYASALEHFRAALALSQRLKQGTEYSKLHCADVLWRLGRYSEADQLVNSLGASTRSQPAFAVWVEQMRAGSRLSQGRYAEASSVARRASKTYPQMEPSSRFDLLSISCVADAADGAVNQATPECQGASEIGQQQGSAYLSNKANLAWAILSLAKSDDDRAKALAEAAAQYFEQNGLRESEFFGLFYSWQASANLRDSNSAASNAKKAVAVYSSFVHTFPTFYFNSYSQRQDIVGMRIKLGMYQHVSAKNTGDSVE